MKSKPNKRMNEAIALLAYFKRQGIVLSLSEGEIQFHGNTPVSHSVIVRGIRKYKPEIKAILALAKEEKPWLSDARNVEGCGLP